MPTGVVRSVYDPNRSGAAVHGGHGNGAGRTAGAENGHGPAGKVIAQVLQGPAKADAVGGVPLQTLLPQPDGIDAAGSAGLRGHIRQIGKNVQLVGHGEVKASQAQGPGGGKKVGKASLGDPKGQIQVIPAQMGNHGVLQQRREAVGDGVADHRQKAGAVVILNLHRRPAFQSGSPWLPHSQTAPGRRSARRSRRR